MTMAYVAVATAVVGVGMGAYGTIEGTKAAKEAQRAQSAMDSLTAARERTKQIRQARKERGKITAAGANQGVGGSSSVRAGGAGAFSQAFQNIGFINMQESGGKLVSAAQQRGINARGISDLGGSLVQASSVMSMFAESDLFKGSEEEDTA